MFGRIILFLFSIFVLFPNSVFADVIINEIMYDLDGSDTGREWIEVYNSGNTPIDLINYKLFEANTNHGLTVFQGDSILDAQDYLIISSDPNKFKNDWPNFYGTILKSSFSLSNEGEDIALKDNNLNFINQHHYDPLSGAQGDGNSLQLISGSWLASTPTPGAINENSSNSSTTETSNVSTEENITVTPSTTKQKIKTQIIVKNIAFVGIPLEFQANTIGYNGELMSYGKYFWNFGDGDSKEIKINESKFFHTYFYPGDHDVNLEYYLAYNSGNPDAIDKKIIKVIVPDIVISKVGEAEDFFIELTNNTNYEANLSSWRLASDRINFSLPQNTILGSKKKIILSPHITGFSIEDKGSLKFMTPQGEVIYSYLTPIIPVPVLPKITSPAVKPLEVLEEDKIGEISEEDLSASVVNSESNNNYLPMFVFVLFLGTTSSAVYFIRSKKKPILSGDDFELIDE